MSTPEREIRSCMYGALLAGTTSGVTAALVSGGLYQLAMKFSPFFAKNFGASSRTALFIMPIFYTSWLNVELSMHECMEKHKPQYVSIQDDDDRERRR